MLNYLKIKNFKGWKDTGPIQMSPITLFFGANSSGKSSIGQFLMMLKQTVENADRKTVLYPDGKNTAVQLGSFQDMVYHHDVQQMISFNYVWTNSNRLIFNIESDQNFTGELMSFESSVRFVENAIVLNSFHYVLINDGQDALSVGMYRDENAHYSLRSNSRNLYLNPLIRNPGSKDGLGTPVRFYGFPDEVVAYYQHAEFVQLLNLWHEKLFRSLFYLGPMRTKADRLYTWMGNAPESVGYSGEYTIPAILAARGRKLSMGPDQTEQPFEAIIANALQTMGLIESFKVSPISDQRQEYEVKICTRGSEDEVNLTDVGFGISQVLPVLVQCFYAPQGSIILMEQPEIHLHPSAQSALADVMIDVINSCENGQPRNIQLIIESHSEHFLRRLQRRIAEDVVSQDKVSAYFANITKTPATLDPLELDKYGNIRNWPDNFFGDEMTDITKQAQAAMKKQIADKQFQSGK